MPDTFPAYGTRVFLQDGKAPQVSEPPGVLSIGTCRECQTPLYETDRYKKYGPWLYGRDCHPFVAKPARVYDHPDGLPSKRAYKHSLKHRRKTRRGS